MSEIDVSVVIISKNEKGLEETLSGLRGQQTSVGFEICVVDASTGALDFLRERYPEIRWIPFTGNPAKSITIPEQRNVGVAASRGSVIAFIDAGCIPDPRWLDNLVTPILTGAEQVTVGLTSNRGQGAIYDPIAGGSTDAPVYVDEAPTINLGFTVEAFNRVGGFDEEFDYGSDIDFTWRLRDAGYRLRFVEAAEISHDWGTRRRQLKRAYVYGQARARLYHKHLNRWRSGLRNDPTVFIYPVFLMLLPVTLFRRFRLYPLLLLVPMWRARRSRPFLTIANHLLFGLGALAYLAGRLTGRL
ncbi:MAG: glycosyltransferase [Microlunatus sp.]